MTSLIGCTRTLSSVARRLNNIRHIMTAKPASAPSDLPFREIRIPVPWGHIAAKEWGSSDEIKILGLHGWMDNCGSFDPMASLLPPHFNLVVIDLPGHGLSSYKPPGTLYNIYEWIPDVRRVILHLRWSRFCLIGHSLGVSVATGYAACYPDEVQALVGLDLIEGKTLPAIQTLDHMSVRIRHCLTDEWTKNYALDAAKALQKLQSSGSGSLTTDSAKIMMIRGSVPVDDGSGKVIFTRDPRLRHLDTTRISHKQALSLTASVKSHVLMIVPEKGLAFSLNESINEIQETVEAFHRNSKSFRLLRVPGTHHFHMNDADKITPEVIAFLEKACAEDK